MGATLRRGVQASHCGGFSCYGAQTLGAQAFFLVAVSRATLHCGAQASH